MAATNNEPACAAAADRSERTLRGPALDRGEGRTSKTARGARRRSVLVSVLESLRKNLNPFRLSSVAAELVRWGHDGISLFRRQLAALKAQLAAASLAGIHVPQRE